MFCTKCGNQIKDGFKFCPKCGAPAYVEKEMPQSEVKEEIEKVSKEVKANPKSDTASVKKKNANATQSKKKVTVSRSESESAIKTLIEIELDIKGVKKKAEQGDKEAILRQAFRCETGIGIEKNIKNSEKLYSQAGGKKRVPELEEILRPTIIPSDH